MDESRKTLIMQRRAIKLISELKRVPIKPGDREDDACYDASRLLEMSRSGMTELPTITTKSSTKDCA